MSVSHWANLQQPLAGRFDAVELLALSGRVHDEPSFERGIERISSVLPVTGGTVSSTPFQRFAADDARRANWLANMNADGPCSLLLGVRGGYGITRLLENAPLSALIDRMNASASVLCGHSDFTALHMALLATALKDGKPVPAMLQGPMLCIDWGAEEAVERTFTDFMRVLKSQRPQADSAREEIVIQDNLRALDAGAHDDISGMLWGGNLSMICALVGTPYLPQVSGGLLFIEDVNEHPYRIERMLLQLYQAGILQKQKALIVGECSDWKPSPLDHGYGLNDALTFIGKTSAVPVFTGLRFGHVADKISLPVGQRAQLAVDSAGHVSLHSAKL